jgi:predicted ATPase
MLDHTQQGFLNIELDPNLLPSPFRVQTNWHVITGTVSAGKTTLIDQLAKKGFHTVSEIGRQYFARELAKGRMVAEIWGSEADQLAIEDMQLRCEARLQASDFVFLDRAFPDSLTMRRVGGLNPNIALPECFHHHYASVFALDRLHLQIDGLRIDDESTANFIDEWLPRDYSALGYRIVRVPKMSIEDRINFILDSLSENKLL